MRYLFLLTLLIGGFFSSGCTAIEERTVALLKETGERVYQAAKDRAQTELATLKDQAKAELTVLRAEATQKLQEQAAASVKSLEDKRDAAKAEFDRTGNPADYAKYQLYAQLAIVAAGLFGAKKLTDVHSEVKDQGQVVAAVPVASSPAAALPLIR
jgi:hypothetical protein